jgi:hypothetical protein
MRYDRALDEAVEKHLSLSSNKTRDTCWNRCRVLRNAEPVLSSTGLSEDPRLWIWDYGLPPDFSRTDWLQGAGSALKRCQFLSRSLGTTMIKMNPVLNFTRPFN